jgi:hypothetical protein
MLVNHDPSRWGSHCSCGRDLLVIWLLICRWRFIDSNVAAAIGRRGFFVISRPVDHRIGCRSGHRRMDISVLARIV